MAITNRERVGRGLDLLRVGLAPFVERELKKHLGGYWKEKIAERLKSGLETTDDGKVRWDTYALLKVMIDNWQSVFRETLGHFERSLAGELLDHRNRFAHDHPFSSEDSLRALDSAERLLTAVSATHESEAVQKLRFELQRSVFAEQARHKTRQAEQIQGQPQAGLKGWREIVTPHPDVASGRYMQAEFAADLHNVHNGIGGEEYTDPKEFFRRTFITDGLKDLLTGALLRLSGTGGDPVVELQTNFGGGKTHSMLALYHLHGGTPTKDLPGLEVILQEAGIDTASKASRAVLVGTHLSVGETSKKSDGTAVRTLWGEMAWQLGGKKGYKLVADSDKNSTPPGAEVLVELFNMAAPCLVLIDEWVAYARNTFGERELPSGTFDAQSTFAQALTEAAKAADRTLVVASIPSSDIEVGGENGKHALAVLKNVFERVGRPWRPASADEGFEIVRRRLFDEIAGKEAHTARDGVVNAFSRMYADNKADFPAGCSEGAYRRKLEVAYPIHPDVFDLLYGEWSTLEKFQRTRGVLRLLAKVIHRLWESNDGGLLIMPSSIPMDDDAVKSELTRYLEDMWEPIISSDIDGPSSLPLELDRANTSTLGRYSAARRVARTLYMGTAPGTKDRNPGIDDRRVRLGCTQPGEAPATFGDALRRISDRAKYIHQDGNRYWVSTKANLNRMAEDRANDLLRPEQEPELLAEVVQRIRHEHKNKPARGYFAGVHPCPEGTAEIHDEPEARLVILDPSMPHRRNQEDSEARKAAQEYLDQRGNSPRINRNTLVFLAADAQRLDELKTATAYYLAWKSIYDEHEALNLDPFQRKQATTKKDSFDETVDLRIRESWVHALVPSYRDPNGGGQSDALIVWDEVRIGGDGTLAARTAAKLKNDGTLLVELGARTLRLHLDRHLWKDKDHVSLGQLSEWFARYLYLPRIVNREVLEGAIRDAASELVIIETFAIAERYDEDKARYVGLKVGGKAPAVLDNNTLLVKPEVAGKQTKSDTPPPPSGGRRPVGGGQGPGVGGGQTGTPGSEPPPEPQKPNLFVGSVKLDGTRLGRDAGLVAEEVLQHLSVLPGAEVEVRLEIQVRVPDGVDDGVVRTVSENANTLKFETHSFERD